MLKNNIFQDKSNLHLCPIQMPTNYFDLFDLPGDVIYFNCASLSPQLRSVTQAGRIALERKIHPWNIKSEDWFNDPERLRSLAASVINADTEGMALIPSVSYGISIAAANIPVRKNQHIIVIDQEYPSNYYSWVELARAKEAKIITVKKEGQTWTTAILNAIDDSTALVAVPNCHWTNGALIDLGEVSKKARAVNAALVVDASQSMGVHPIDIAVIQPDFLVSVGYKWLLGPYGLGYLYAAPKWRRDGKPIEYSWLTKNESENFANLVNYRDDFRSGARRFDMGEFPGFIHVPMAIAALTQILEWGVPNIQAYLKSISQKIVQKATELDLSFPGTTERSAHMIGIDLPGGVPEKLKENYEKARIYVGFRGKSIRIAPYLYTKDEDIDTLFGITKQHLPPR
jgi:selenocysteine lyase/cysteine desulfurase